MKMNEQNEMKKVDEEGYRSIQIEKEMWLMEIGILNARLY